MRQPILTSLAVLVATVSLVVPLRAADTCLLQASAPGAYSVRYWPDRAVLSYSSKTPVTVKVQLPSALKWAVADGKPLAAAKSNWDTGAGCCSVDLPAGDHTVQLGWAGHYTKPAVGQTIPVLLDGKAVGKLTCSFDLAKMTARGSLPDLTGMATPSLKLRATMPAKAVSLTVGSVALTDWQAQDQSLLSRKPAVVADGAGLTLTVKSYDLATSPVAAIALQNPQLALQPKRLTAMPDGLVIEAEDFTGQGQGHVQISAGKHFEEHGGKSIFSNAGDGHWLEWKFIVPLTGRYNLFVRAATQDPADLRLLTIDGRAPQGLGLIRFPGTGGWGYAKSEWAILQLSGLSKSDPPLELTGGQHVLRLTGADSTQLNLDYFVLAPVK